MQGSRSVVEEMLSNPQAFSADQDGCLEHTGEKLDQDVSTELQSTSRKTYRAFLRSAALPKPPHLGTSHCHTIPGLTHLPGMG